jgi:hypothetical protein
MSYNDILLSTSDEPGPVSGYPGLLDFVLLFFMVFLYVLKNGRTAWCKSHPWPQGKQWW